MTKKWTKKEIRFLKENYISITVEDIANKLNRNKRSIYNKLHWLGLLKTKFISRSEILKEYYHKNFLLAGIKTATKHNHKGENNPMYGKSHSEKTKRLISLMRTKFKLSKTKLKKLYYQKNLSTIKISNLYNLNPETVRFRMKKFGIPRKKPSEANFGKKFTEEHKRKISQTRIIKNLSKGDKNPMSKPKNVKAWIKSNNIKPNKPEKFLIKLINKHDLPFIYNGNKADLIIGRRIPDFYNKNGKNHIIELFGEVFHNPNKSFFEVPPKRTEDGTIKYYRKFDYRVLIVWEKELENPDAVLKKIITFDGKQ